jgi:hypothetical protein
VAVKLLVLPQEKLSVRVLTLTHYVPLMAKLVHRDRRCARVRGLIDGGAPRVWHISLPPSLRLTLVLCVPVCDSTGGVAACGAGSSLGGCCTPSFTQRRR